MILAYGRLFVTFLKGTPIVHLQVDEEKFLTEPSEAATSRQFEFLPSLQGVARCKGTSLAHQHVILGRLNAALTLSASLYF